MARYIEHGINMLKKSFISWLMTLSQHIESIVITFLNFVHVYLTPTMWLILQYLHLHI